jgi:hypothetical protein
MNSNTVQSDQRVSQLLWVVVIANVVAALAQLYGGTIVIITFATRSNSI